MNGAKPCVLNEQASHPVGFGQSAETGQGYLRHFSEKLDSVRRIYISGIIHGRLDILLSRVNKRFVLTVHDLIV